METKYNAPLCVQWKPSVESLFDPPRRRGEPFKPMNKIKRGTSREDGMVFARYRSGNPNKEQWTTPEQYAQNNQKHRELASSLTPEQKKKRADQVKVWRSQNKDKVRAIELRTTQKRRNEIRIYMAKYQIQRKKADPLFKLMCSCRSRLYAAIKGKGWEKTQKTQDLLGCDWETLKFWIETQFQEGMTWGNHGKWHIDHIIPRSSFEYSSPDDPEFKKCWSLSNLQPLWAVDNIRKNAKIGYLI